MKALTQTEINASQFFKRYGSRNFPPRLTEAEKYDLIAEGTPFHIVGVHQYTHKQYGTSWVLDLDFGDENVRSLFLKSDEQRDRMFTGLQEFLLSNPYLPAKLDTVDVGAANPYQTIEPIEPAE